MAINIPIVTEFVDVGLKSASGAFDNFRTKVGEAEGGLGKLKAGAGAAFDGIKANAGAMALGAGTAIAGFALKAIGDFQDLALEVDKFSNATGLAAEESSKWIEVAGDIGVESGTLLTAFNRMNKAIGDNSKAFGELGVEIVRTSSGATDVNATFLNTVEALRKIQDPAKRAQLATQILGKSWTELSELVEMGAGSLKSALDDVSGAKVIDEAEIQKAKDLRAAQDALGDAFDEFVLMVGTELIPVLTKASGAAADLVGLLGKLAEGIAESTENSDGFFDSVVELLNPFDAWQDALDHTDSALDDVDGAIQDVTDEQRLLNDAWRDGYRAMIDARTATEDLTTALTDVDDALAVLKGNIDERQAWRNLQDELDRVRDAAVKAFTEATPEALRDSEAALDRARLKVAGYIAEIDTIPPDRKTDFIARLDQANLDEVERILAYLARPRSMGIIVGVGETPSEVRGVAPRMATLGLGAGSPNVTVNVAGSVVAENDLVESVRKGLVNSQRNGSQLVYTNK